MTSMTLPGLCGPEDFKARIVGLAPAKAFLAVSRHLFDISQRIQMHADGQVDSSIRSDARFGSAVMLSISLTLTVDEAAQRKAWKRSRDIQYALKQFGTGGPAGKLAQAALQLARAIQTLDSDLLAPVIDLLDAAAQERAIEQSITPTAYTAGVQMSLLRHLNG